MIKPQQIFIVERDEKMLKKRQIKQDRKLPLFGLQKRNEVVWGDSKKCAFENLTNLE